MLGIGGVINGGGIGNSHTITENIEVCYYAISKVVFKDTKSKQARYTLTCWTRSLIGWKLGRQALLIPTSICQY